MAATYLRSTGARIRIHARDAETGRLWVSAEDGSQTDLIVDEDDLLELDDPGPVVDARDREALTVGELAEILEQLPQDAPITIMNGDGLHHLAGLARNPDEGLFVPALFVSPARFTPDEIPPSRKT